MAHQAGDGIGRGSGRGVNRHVEASLPLLARQPAHGRQLSKCVKEALPIAGDLADISTVYRSLVDLTAVRFMS